MKHKRALAAWVVAVAFGALLVLAGCGKSGRSGGATRGSGTAASAGVSAKAALSGDWEGAAARWAVAADGARYAQDGKGRRYGGKTVFELLNGGAEAYLDAGLRALFHARFRDAARTYDDYEVTVFAMGSPAQARALLASEKGPGARDVALADGGAQERGMVLFVKGRHLVKVAALPTGKRKAPPLVAVARAVLASGGVTW